MLASVVPPTCTMRVIASLPRALGIDRSIVFNLGARAFGIVAQPLTLVLIASRLSAAEQGYYYTFFSLLGLSFFLELGLGVVLTQFASHEFNRLRWTADRRLDGDPTALGRLLRLIRLSLAWYGVLLLVLVAGMVPAGLVFFAAKHAGPPIPFESAWVLLVVLFGLNTLFVPLMAILEGCGEVPTVQFVRFVQAMAGSGALWVALVGGGKLFSIPAQFAAYLVCASVMLGVRYRGLLRQAMVGHRDLPGAFSWRDEVLPMQWRVALTTAVAYFAGGLFTPLAFRYQGPVVAGAVGLSLSVTTAVGNVGLAWVSTKAPIYGSLAAAGDREVLDRIAGTRTRQGVTVCVTLFIVLIAATGVASVLFQSMSAYLRAFKREPLFPVSILVAGVMALTAWTTARFFSAEAMVLGLMVVNCTVMLPLAFLVFRRERRHWWRSAPSTEPVIATTPWVPE
jgi:hypothetical protein